MEIQIPELRTPTQTAAVAPRAAEEELGRTAFLELMIAQVQNQDPLEPAKNEAFIAQLAQFSSVEGIQNLNESMDSLVGRIRSSMTMDAAVLVGRNVLVPTDQTLLNTAGGIAGSINVTDPAPNMFVEVVNSAGQVMHRENYGAQPAGDFRFVWDGQLENGQTVEPDRFRVRAYTEQDGGQTPFAVSLPDQVISVTINEGNLIANLAGGSAVPANQIREIQ